MEDKVRITYHGKVHRMYEIWRMARAWDASASWKTSPDAKKGSAPGCPALLQPSPVSRDPNQPLSEEMPIVFHSVTMTQHFSKLASGIQIAPRRILREKDQARSSPEWQGSPDTGTVGLPEDCDVSDN